MIGRRRRSIAEEERHSEEGPQYEPEPFERIGAGARLGRIPRGALIAGGVIFVLLAMILFLLYQLGSRQALERDTQEVERTARVFIEALTTFDAGTIESQTEKVVGLSTGTMLEEYQRELDNGYVRTMTEAEVVSTGEVLGAEVSSITRREATVQVRFDVVTVNKDRPEPQLSRNRVELTLVKSSEGWKVEGLRSVP